LSRCERLASCVSLPPALRCRVAFEQDLRAYLESLEDEATGVALPSRRIDEHELHRYLLDRVRVLEGTDPQAVVGALFDEWSRKLASFARYLEALPTQLFPMDRQDAIALACRALDVAMGLPDPDMPFVERLELQRIVGGFVGGKSLIASYAYETRLVRRGRSHGSMLTELGRVFLRLRGKDAVRWLLTSEVLQSTGPFDPWRASHDLLEAALVASDLEVDIFDDERTHRFSKQALSRLAQLGGLRAVTDGDGVFYFQPAAAMRDVLQAAIDPGPWHVAIRALLDDERALVLPGSSSSAMEATVEQTKLIAHEVRNALIPVRHDIDALRSHAVEPAQSRRIDTAKQGVVRVLAFVDAMVHMSELITEPSTRCEIGAVVDEALGWSDIGQRVERVPFSGGAVHLIAPRARLARAISNIVGNALQATSSEQQVRVTIARAPGVVRIAVDDGGPGVPIEHRARVFLEGVTMRQDGAGSGFGLAFARRVVEGALHGKVWCEDSDLGGARFVIEVPEASE
jgi:signal transduction histidine kinase